MQEAHYYIKNIDGSVNCTLCPHQCKIPPGGEGLCKARENNGGILYSKVYGQLVAAHIDPIEKKPLYHFYPGSKILSIGTMGCNFHCSFCQNHAISQCSPGVENNNSLFTSTEIVHQAKGIPNNLGVAYTYNEPIVFYEYLLETARKIHHQGLKNVMVSNGYIMPKPLKKLLPYIDAFNIDLKAFSNKFYKTHAKGTLKPVLDTLEAIVKANKHLEITNLLITNTNDNEGEFEEMAQWIAANLGENTPLHISRYFPVYQMSHPATPITVLENFYGLAKNHLNHVYLGNVFDQQRSATYCQNCHAILVHRNRYSVKTTGIDHGKCAMCKAPSQYCQLVCL